MPIIKLLQASNDQSQEVIVWVRVRPDSDYLWLRDAKMAAYNLDSSLYCAVRRYATIIKATRTESNLN